MGVSALPDICEGLIGAGMEKDMPAAILQKGTTAGQKRIVATVSTLEEEVKRQGIETPAIIVVGKVCTLAEKFGWYEELPLSGWKVLVTRPKELVSRTADKLREKARRFWSFRRSVLSPWKTRAVPIKRWITWRNISGLYLPALQV